LKRLLLRRKPHRTVDADVAVDARHCVEELWELEAGVPEHCHHRSRALRLKLSMEEPSKIRSKTSLSRTSLDHAHLLGGCDGGPDSANAEDGKSHGAMWQQWKLRCSARRGPLEEDREVHPSEGPHFRYSDDPLDADDWLRVINNQARPHRLLR
jgi:hypothetical protein